VTDITDHLAHVRHRIENAANSAGRDAADIMLLAVSKGHTVAAVREAYSAGQRDFGENFVQEAIAKIEDFGDSEARWHFIGQIQSNKTRDIARHFHWVHTIDRLKTARRLSEQRPHYATPLAACIQVNLAGEPQKGGVSATDLAPLAREIAALPRVTLRGLMTIPPADASDGEISVLFAELGAWRRRLNERGLNLDTLSMGMSADLELAIAQGSTIVRVGTAIFGPRRRGRVDDPVAVA
jgi:pyridoxal phosphate enzyme (YggS family)